MGGYLAEMQKRQTAVKVSIGGLLSGSYVKQDGMLPNYVLLSDNSKVSRVNLMGVVLVLVKILVFSLFLLMMVQVKSQLELLSRMIN